MNLIGGLFGEIINLPYILVNTFLYQIAHSSMEVLNANYKSYIVMIQVQKTSLFKFTSVIFEIIIIVIHYIFVSL